MGEVVFAEGVLTNMWAGIFTQVQKLTPGPFPPFSFSKATAISSKKKIDLFSSKYIHHQKGGLIKIIDNVKSLAKMTVMVQQDFHSFNFQLKAFVIAIGLVFCEDSILVTKLCDLAKNVIRKHSIIYKNRIAIINTFAAKVL